MKNLLIISTHSFVDLITNSSSELFICDTDKTLETIKDILIDLAEKHDIPGDSLFQTVIKEPTVCKYNFDLNNYPNKAEYNQFHDWDWNNKSSLEKETDNKWRYWESENKIQYPQCPYKYGTEEYKANYNKWHEEIYEPFCQSKEYKDYQDKRTIAYNKIHKELFEKRSSLREEMLRWAFNWNNIPYNPIPRPDGLYSLDDPKWIEWRAKHDANIEFNEAEDQFETAASYGFTLKKGNILIESQEDNSIPWDLMDDIANIFGGQRIHLG